MWKGCCKRQESCIQILRRRNNEETFKVPKHLWLDVGSAFLHNLSSGLGLCDFAGRRESAMIYTSYFGRIKNLGPRVGNLVSIARGAPEWFRGASHLMLAPSKKLLWRYKNGDLSPEGYKEEFTRKLEGLSVVFVGQICQGEVLLCWEGPGLFCHRHLVRDWFKKPQHP